MRLNEGKQNQLNFREMKQTAVEWLVEELSDVLGPMDTNSIRDLLLMDAINRAKEMEKEQMVDFAFKYGDLTTREIADSFDKEYKTK
jgi:hypothetical protein